MWAKAIFVGGAVAVGGPWLTWKLMPTEEDLRKKYDQADFNMGADERRRKREVFDDYMKEIVELSKSNKNVWLAYEEHRKKKTKIKRREMKASRAAKSKMVEEIRKEAMVAGIAHGN